MNTALQFFFLSLIVAVMVCCISWGYFQFSLLHYVRSIWVESSVIYSSRSRSNVIHIFLYLYQLVTIEFTDFSLCISTDTDCFKFVRCYLRVYSVEMFMMCKHKFMTLVPMVWVITTKLEGKYGVDFVQSPSCFTFYQNSYLIKSCLYFKGLLPQKCHDPTLHDMFPPLFHIIYSLFKRL
jgi:hypothetical protein